MGKIADFFVELGLRKEKFDKGMDEAANAAQKKLIPSFNSVGAAIGAAFSVGAIVAFTKQAMIAWDQQMKAEAGLLQALKGREMVQKALIQQAGELQRKTLFGDEVTVEAQKMLALMGLSATQIKDLIPLVQDFAQATGMDLAGAANLVAKTVGSSTNALGRYGVEIDATASKAEKAAAVMAVFTDRYGGQAEKAAKVGVSGLQQLQGAWGDIMEVIGAKVGPFMSALSKLLSGKLLDAASGASATGLQKTVTEYLNADEAGRKKIVSGLEFSLAEYKKLWLDAIEKNDDKNRAHWALQMDYTREALTEINKLNTESTAVVEVSEEDKRAAWDKTQAKLRETAQIAEDASEAMRKSLLWSLEDAPKRWHDEMKQAFEDVKKMALPEMGDEEGIDDIPFNTEAISTAYQQMAERAQMFREDMAGLTEGFIEDMIVSFAEGFADLATGDTTLDQFFKGILGKFGGFIAQMGKLMISYGIAMGAFKKAFQNPIGLVVAGAALVVIGKAISNLAAKGAEGSMTDGSGSTAGMTGGYGTAGGGYTGQAATGGGKLMAEVKGSDLVFILERANNNINRIRP